MNSEAEDNHRLRKANEFLTHSKEVENQARIALARAVEQTKLAKSKHETLFMECEARAVTRARVV